MNSKMKKILFLHSSSDFYGASKVLIQTVSAVKNNNDIPFVVLSEEGPLADYFRSINVSVFIVRLGILRKKYFNFLGILNRIWFLTIGIFRLINIVRKNKIDIIYSNTAIVFIGCFVAILTRMKHVFHVHELIEKPKLLAKFVAKLVDISAKKVIVVSNIVADEWVKYGISKDKITVIYNSIDMLENSNESFIDLKSSLGISNDTKLIGVVGRINLGKGHKYFFEIAQQLLMKNELNYHFVYIGDVYPGNEHLYEVLKCDISNLGIDKFVTYLGYQSDVKPYVEKFDLLVVPSIYPESFGLVILEAMSLNVPVAVTAHGGPKEIVLDGVTGLHLPLNDSVVSASKINDLLNNPTLVEKIKLASKLNLNKEFSIQNFQNKVIHVLNEI